MRQSPVSAHGSSQSRAVLRPRASVALRVCAACVRALALTLSLSSTTALPTRMKSSGWQPWACELAPPPTVTAAAAVAGVVVAPAVIVVVAAPAATVAAPSLFAELILVSDSDAVW